ncbi:MAG: M28 family peptidase [Ignavibacteria bacterium]|nr:M28 family peptidase [Ignavibacteria bacterium]
MNEKIFELTGLLSKVNVSSADNGEFFTDLTRLNNINEILNNSSYCLLCDGSLSFIRKHQNFNDKNPAVLISCHIDSIYEYHFWEYYDNKTILGTLDNSITNSILISLMLKNVLHPNVLISFTGDEENDSAGASETVEYISGNQNLIWENLVSVISLDVTGEGYDSYDFSIENWFVKKNFINEPKIFFNNKKEYKKYLRSKFNETNYKILYIHEKDDRAAPDDTWEYDEYDLNCFSMCLPTLYHPKNNKLDQEDWMHDDKGILAKIESI